MRMTTRRPRTVGLPAFLAALSLPLLLAACAASAPVAGGAPSSRPLADASAIGGAHVVHPVAGTPYIAGGDGQFLLLRGIDDNALVQYPSDYREAPPVSKADFAEMAALGFDFLRLPVSWSEIMPAPGVISKTYLDRVAQVVRWAGAEGIGVLVDMHQDNYSTVTDFSQESDGAPAWAVLDGGAPCTPDLTTTKCALAAFASFWANSTVHGKPLQTWYLEAALAVAKAAGATSHSSNVVGVELMNEPWPAGPEPFQTASLYPFYDRMIAGLRAGGVVVPLWFEPSIIRDLTNDALGQAARFSDDPNLVYAVHMYTGVFSPPFDSSVTESQLSSSYADAAAEAKVFGTPFMVDEYGSNPTPAWNEWLTEQLSLQNAYQVGSGFWLWKQRIGHWYDWATVHLNGSLRRHTLRAQLLGGPHVDAVPGDLLATSSTPESLSATVDGPGGTAFLWGGTVVKSGGPTVTTHTLTRVTIDSKPVATSCHVQRFEAPGTSLEGCLLQVHVPAGHHLIEATAG